MKQYRRILIVRTDRIGDVVLSTPVIKVLRDNYPKSYIAIMVSPFTCELVQGNPYLNEVIIYDKDDKHKGILSSIKFALALRRKKFDLAIILHSTNRVNIITYLAGIKNRLGYSRRLGFLLTKNIPYCKYKGEKHEVEYNLDLLRSLGLKITDASLLIPKNSQSEAWAEEVLRANNVSSLDRIVVLHPSASCVSRMWPLGKFAEVADDLISRHKVKIIIVSGENDVSLANKLCKLIKHRVINISGKTNLMQLASILRRAKIMVSNDSGPVHIAVGCGLSVVVLFGRSQPGISPIRWGPRGKDDVVLHKKIGCPVCLAHDCEKGFVCLKSIKSADVLAAVDGILKL